MNLVWSEEATNSLVNIYEYILKDSPQNAVMVIDKIIELAEKLNYFQNIKYCNPRKNH